MKKTKCRWKYVSRYIKSFDREEGADFVYQDNNKFICEEHGEVKFVDEGEPRRYPPPKKATIWEVLFNCPR